MEFRARVRPLSLTARRWRTEGKTGGLLASVAFRWDGKNYSTDVLGSSEVEALYQQGHVELIFTETSVPIPVLAEPSPEPVVEPVPEPAVEAPVIVDVPPPVRRPDRPLSLAQLTKMAPHKKTTRR